MGRRALLTSGAAGAAAALAGCTSDGDRGGPRKPSAAERAAAAEAALRARSVATSRDLLLRYDAVIEGHPALAARLAPLRASVAAHVKALGEGGAAPAPGPTASTPPSAAAASSSASPAAASPSGSPASVRVPSDPAAALQDLAAAVRGTADTHTAALLTAPPEYARLLASVAASGAAHAYLLTEGARG
ncbi:hypothetical protein [Streptomyces roseicoloratus]|uniref:Lipoprotein n=1 Tax=Streptomyces roseicoloratus TaxID=2508722 RepID=A0ABY9S2Y6_9ACTN|nr:hypothetical protein [Streptomyces roseicoloratus]WMX48792.1 hypothetical protein RGF97_07855 [Streptomyces roseicoloratus]